MPTDQGAATIRLAPITRSKLAATVAQQLLEQIRSNGLAPGTRMPSERELMAALGVGRSTIREAMNGLAMLGVVEIRHGQGAFVIDPDAGAPAPRTIAAALSRGLTFDFREARKVVEVHVARLAAERRTDANLDAIAECIADLEGVIESGGRAAEPLARFHVRLGEAAHSEVLASFVNSFAEVMMGDPSIRAAEAPEQQLEQHRSLYEAIRDRDSELAGARMAAHLDAADPHPEALRIA